MVIGEERPEPDHAEAIAAYLADARAGDAEEIAHAANVADRARALIDARRSNIPKRA